MSDGNLKTAILDMIAGNNKASASKIAKTLSVTQRTVERYIKELCEESRLIRHGSAHGGYWEVKKWGALDRLKNVTPATIVKEVLKASLNINTNSRYCTGQCSKRIGR